MSAPAERTLLRVDTLFLNALDNEPGAATLTRYCDTFNEFHQGAPVVYLTSGSLSSKLAEMGRDLRDEARPDLGDPGSNRLAFTWSWTPLPANGRIPEPENWTAGNTAQVLR